MTHRAARTPTNRFITFEGIDGSGKSTQLRLLADHLLERGLPVIMTREPGGTPLGINLRRMLLDVHGEVDPLAELLLYAADRAQHVRTIIRPQLQANRIILSDRYADATIAYQGAGRGLSSETIARVVAFATEGLQPDLTLLFDVAVTKARARTQRRRAGASETDRFDREDAEFQTRVRDAYLKIAAAEPQRVRIIDSATSLEETHAQVLNIVLPFLDLRF